MMKTRAVRLYGKKDLRIGEFELPAITDDEILAKVVTDSICLSSYKAVNQGADHKRVPGDVAKNPVIIGHEFAGEIMIVGAKWQHRYKRGQKFSIQPAIFYKDGPVGIFSAPGYSYKYIGGDATYVIIPKDVLVQDCLLVYDGPGYFPASLAEPLSCVIGSMHACFHTTPGSYIHKMDIVNGGKMAILAGAGSMGLAMISYIINREDRKPSLCVVTDIDQSCLDRAALVCTVEEARARGINLVYVNTSVLTEPVNYLRGLTSYDGFNEVFVMTPLVEVIEQGDALLAHDGCLNFFSGPSDPNLKAGINFYNIHYSFTHMVATSGGNNDDMKEALHLLSKGLDLGGLVTHIGGLNAVVDTTLNLPGIHGGKKLIYTHIDMPLTPLVDFAKLGMKDSFFATLADILKQHKGVWNVEAESYLMDHFGIISHEELVET